MNSNNIVTIGTALKWRGEYTSQKTYYQDNIVLAAGCLFRCKPLKLQDRAPIQMSEEGHFTLINQDAWDVILDMSVYYNKIADIEHYANESQETCSQLQQALTQINMCAQLPIKLTDVSEMEALIEANQVQPGQLYYTVEKV